MAALFGLMPALDQLPIEAIRELYQEARESFPGWKGALLLYDLVPELTDVLSTEEAIEVFAGLVADHRIDERDILIYDVMHNGYIEAVTQYERGPGEGHVLPEPTAIVEPFPEDGGEAFPGLDNKGLVLGEFAVKLQQLEELRAEVDELATRAREHGATWTELGRLARISPQAAYQRWSAQGKEKHRLRQQRFQKNRGDN